MSERLLPANTFLFDAVEGKVAQFTLITSLTPKKIVLDSGEPVSLSDLAAASLQ